MNAPTETTINQLQRQVAPREASMPAVHAGFFDLQSFELMQRVSKAFASSDLVPQQYRGNLPNCMIAMDMAQRIGANPLMVMQNLYIVHGTPGWSSKFLVATINACGRFTSLRYEWKGEPGKDDYGCRAWAIERDTGERLDGIWVTWKMVKAEGWDSKNGSKWKTMPDQMFVYRAAAFWQRAYAPELAMGLQTTEEIADVYDAGRRPDGSFEVTTETLKGEATIIESNATVDAPATNVQDGAGAAASETHPVQTADPFASHREAIADCKDMSALIRLMNDMPAKAKKALHAELEARQIELKPKAGPVTYAAVMEKMQSAKDTDLLDAAADLIRQVEDEGQQAELTAAYKSLRAKLVGE